MTNTDTMNHKEMTAHIRTRIKKAGIKASVSKYTSCGVNWVRVAVCTHDGEFTPLEQAAIKIIAQSNKLTLAQGLPIIIENSTNPQQFNFVMP